MSGVGAVTESSAKGPRRHNWLYAQVILAIVLGGAVGHFYPEFGSSLKPLGDAFIKLVKLIIPPVIFLTVATGIAGGGQIGGLGRVAGKALFYFIVVSTIALVIGLVVANVFQPGAGMNVDPATLDAAAVADYANRAHDQSIVGFLMSVIPNSFVGAFTDGQVLQVLFVAVLFGLSLAFAGTAAAPILKVMESASAVFFRFVHLVMRFAPLGAFGAFAFTIGEYGIKSVINLAALVSTFYLTSAGFIVVVLGAIAALAGFSIFRLIGYLRQEIFLVLGTSSSEAALPTLMEKMEQAGCDKRVVGLVVPTGYSFNLDGTNIYMTLAALFIAQATGVHLSLQEQVTLLLVAVLSSKGAAGVTGAGFVTLAATLSVVPSVPVAGLALILGIDRFMSECRAITNFMGNAVATVVVARWENAVDRDRLRDTLGLFGRSKPTPIAKAEGTPPSVETAQAE